MNNGEDYPFGEMFLQPPELFGQKPVKHYEQIVKVTIHHYYINGEIHDEMDNYVDMVHTIKTAEPHDKIFLHLNTPGGSLTSTIAILSAMKQSVAEITSVNESEICSAGTFIFLAADNYIVNDHCSFFIHNYSHGPYGKGAEVANRVKFSEEHYKSLVDTFYKGFLTDNEIENVLDDRDFWLNAEEIKKRLIKQKRGNLIIIDPEEMEISYDNQPPKKTSTRKKAVKKTATRKKTVTKK